MPRSGVFGLAVLCVLMTTAGQVVLKIGVSNPVLLDLLSSGQKMIFLGRAVASPMVVAGFLLYGAGALLWLLVLGNADLSYAYPLISLGFVASAIFAHFAMNEALGATRVIGIALICVGAVLVARS